MLTVLTVLPSGSALAARTNYHGRCELPKAAWSEEALRIRDAAVRECKENTVRLGNDRHAALVTDAEDRFLQMLEARKALLEHANPEAAARDASRRH